MALFLPVKRVFIKVSAEYPPACWGDESGPVRNPVWGGSLPRNAPQLAVGFFTNLTPFIPLPLVREGEEIERGASPLLDSPFASGRYTYLGVGWKETTG